MAPSPDMIARLSLLLLAAVATVSAVTPDGRHKLVFIAGKPSHPPGMHEFHAGTLLLEQCLKSVPQLVVDRHDMGWVSDEATFADADAVVIYADGGKGHPAVQGNHRETLQKLMARGVGFGCMHYGVEVVPDLGGKEFQAWLGGHYENAYSCNPIWDAAYATFVKHPITAGVEPFTTNDEWYFHMRFRGAIGHGDKPATDAGLSFTPILVATPPDATRDGPYVYPKGPYPHIQAEKGAPETMMWAVERPDGGRGFGFTGGHFHKNWGNDQVRKVVLNALVWVSKLDVPAGGVPSRVSEDQLRENLDPKPQPKGAAILSGTLRQRWAQR
jgi:hypothetical protein